jgi:hypothetical protein
MVESMVLSSKLRTIHHRMNLTKPRISKKTSSEPSFFLGLPREIRDEIYSYLVSPLATLSCYRAEIRSENYVEKLGTPNSPGITCISPPRHHPMYLLLICKQIHSEVMQHFYAHTTFHVGDLIPQKAFWCIDPVYDSLATNEHLGTMRRVGVRIGLDQLPIWTSSPDMVGRSRIETLDPKKSIEMMQSRARHLAAVLLHGATDLRTVMISWWDDWGADVPWDVKKEVLLPFWVLAARGIRLEIGEVSVFRGEDRIAMMEQLQKTFRELADLGVMDGGRRDTEDFLEEEWWLRKLKKEEPVHTSVWTSIGTSVGTSVGTSGTKNKTPKQRRRFMKEWFGKERKRRRSQEGQWVFL